MKKLIALASGDWHWHLWKQLNEKGRRTNVTERFMVSMFQKSHNLKIPILFTGDLFHTPEGINTNLMERAILFFSEIQASFPDARLIGISGNHDLSETNNHIKHSPSLFRAMCYAFPKLIHSIDYTYIFLNGITVFGIPYLTHNIGFKEILLAFEDMLLDYKTKQKHILLIHTDLPGARDTNNREINSHDNLKLNLGEIFKNFGLVLSGHIHKYQVLWGNKVVMVGAPNHQRKTDIGCPMYYMEIYDDLSFKPIETNWPEFKTYQEGTEPDNDTDFWIMIPKPKKVDKVIKAGFVTTNKVALAKNYIKEKGIKSQKKLNALINILQKTDE